MPLADAGTSAKSGVLLTGFLEMRAPNTKIKSAVVPMMQASVFIIANPLVIDLTIGTHTSYGSVARRAGSFIFAGVSRPALRPRHRRIEAPHARCASADRVL